MKRYRDFLTELSEASSNKYKPMRGTLDRQLTVTVAETGKKMKRNAVVYGGIYAVKLKGKWVYVYDVDGRPTVFQSDVEEGKTLHVTQKAKVM